MGVCNFISNSPFHRFGVFNFHEGYALFRSGVCTKHSCFLIMPYCNTECTNLFLDELSRQYADDVVLLCCDGAAWHKSKSLQIPQNIFLFPIPPYTPEMNPIEQIWKEIRKMGFRNEVFTTLEKVVDRLCDTICNLSTDIIQSITCRKWIIEPFN